MKLSVAVTSRCATSTIGSSATASAATEARPSAKETGTFSSS
jgi:hypothetical protein